MASDCKQCLNLVVIEKMLIIAMLLLECSYIKDCVCLSVCDMCRVLAESRRGHHIVWIWSYS